MFTVLSGLVFLCAMSAQMAHASDSWWTIQSEEIHKISETTLPSQTLSSMDLTSSCSNLDAINPLTSNPGNPLSQLSLSQIVNFGQQIWTFIQNNEPVVNAQTRTANALPHGTTCWTDLENWQPPRSETYQIVYKNLFGISVVNMEFSLIYSYG